jgi:hypothetical protein
MEQVQTSFEPVQHSRCRGAVRAAPQAAALRAFQLYAETTVIFMFCQCSSSKTSEVKIACFKSSGARHESALQAYQIGTL